MRILIFDYLRVIAFIFILFYHFYPNLYPGGFLGLDLLFALSGFLATGKLMDQEAEAWRRGRGGFSLASFYRKRAYRLWPALILCLLIGTGLSWLMSTDYQVNLNYQVAAALGGVTNYYEILTGGSYENQFIRHLFLPTWSLGVEIRFYLLFGLMAWALKKLHHPRETRKILGWTSLAMIVLSTILLAWGWSQIPKQIVDTGQKDQLMALLYFCDVTRLGAFFWGVLAACLTGTQTLSRSCIRLIDGLPEFLLWIIFGVDIGAFAYLCWKLSYSNPWTYMGGFVGVGSLSFLLLYGGRILEAKIQDRAQEAWNEEGLDHEAWYEEDLDYDDWYEEDERDPWSAAYKAPRAGLHKFGRRVRAISNQGIVSLSALSYGIYLFHWPIFVFCDTLFVRIVAVGLALVTSGVLSWLSLHYWEPIFTRVMPEYSQAPQLEWRSVWISSFACFFLAAMVLLLAFFAPDLTSFEGQYWQYSLAAQVDSLSQERTGVQAMEEKALAQARAEQATQAGSQSANSSQTQQEDPQASATNTPDPSLQAPSSGLTPGDLNDQGFEGSVTIIGDSVLLGPKEYLQEHILNSYVFAQGFISFDKAIQIVGELKAKDQLGKNIVVAIGTNGRDSFRQDVDQIIEMLPEGHRLIFVTPFDGRGDPSWNSWQTGAYERTLPQYYPFITVNDWAAYASPRPELYKGTDLVHFYGLIDTYEQYTAQLLLALQEASQKPAKTQADFEAGRQRQSQAEGGS